MMRHLVLVAVLILSFSAMTVAQELPQYEIFGGFSLLRPDGGDVGTVYGWNASVTANITEYVGIVMDGSGYYDSEEDYCARAHNFMVGPRFSIRAHERLKPFYHFMGGVIHTGMDVMTDEEWIAAETDNFALAFGGGLDVKVDEMFSVRPFQADYVFERSYGDFIPHIRFSAGIVIALGER